MIRPATLGKLRQIAKKLQKRNILNIKMCKKKKNKECNIFKKNALKSNNRYILIKS